MNKILLDWQLALLQSENDVAKEWFAATVPGAAQLDYANAQNWDTWYLSDNVKAYAALEDVFWLYKAPLSFALSEDQRAELVFTAIDYKYRICVNEEVLYEGEGMFSPIRLDVSRYSGLESTLEVLIWPSPKSDDSNCRDQADHSCKAAACYGWDWHPRLLTAGIWDEAYLQICNRCSIKTMDVSYRLSDALDRCTVTVPLTVGGSGSVRLRLLYGDREVARQEAQVESSHTFTLAFDGPRLWWPVGYGDQPIYTLEAEAGGETLRRSVGFRRVRLVMNEDTWGVVGYPKTRAPAPATLEVNGVRVFAKGSNWVNAQLFPGQMNAAHYRSLLQKARDANMNLMRVWGGGFVNKQSFFDICDELGIMVWQEFPLACNEYPDEDGYLAVLKKEAVSIVRRLRTHPCVVLWCGGNELFNSWSGMTEQHHALRLLDSVCYAEDRFTPFIMTSPLNGMAHGPYVNYYTSTGKESITMLREHYDTAYTEFGSPAMSPKEVIMTFMDKCEFDNCKEGSPAWEAHFGFHAASYEAWIRFVEVDKYFGGWTDTEDLIRKTQYLQAMCYRSIFEEARFQWPHCSMVANWCWNEPWPCAANCSVIAWPDVPKPSHSAIATALRPRAAALRIDRHLWSAGETFSGDIWVLNDHAEVLQPGSVTLQYAFDGEWITWGSLQFASVASRKNLCCGTFSVKLPEQLDGFIRIRLKVAGCPEMDSEYTYFCHCKNIKKKKMLNADW